MSLDYIDIGPGLPPKTRCACGNMIYICQTSSDGQVKKRRADIRTQAFEVKPAIAHTCNHNGVMVPVKVYRRHHCKKGVADAV